MNGVMRDTDIQGEDILSFSNYFAPLGLLVISSSCNEPMQMKSDRRWHIFIPILKKNSFLQASLKDVWRNGIP